MVLSILRFSFIFLLFFLFFYEFGIESIRKFLAKQKFVVESSREYTDSDHPAITVCASNGLHGWRDGTILKHPFEKLCSEATNAQEAYQCINENTFDLSDILSGAVDGNSEEIKESDWKVGIFRLNRGKCFTLNPASADIGTEIKHHLKIKYTDDNITQYTLIHDPEFYIPGPNPSTMPSVFSIQTPSYGTKTFYIDTIQHVKMNLPTSPCQESGQYSLTKCVAEALSKKIGCKPEWESSGEESMKICTDVNQLIQYESAFREISKHDKDQILNRSGCLLPCQYKEYKIVDTPLDSSGKSRIMRLMRSTNAVLVKTEQLVYPFSSFLAEFGGALGLFLGFSFLWVWDVMQIFIKWMIRFSAKGSRQKIKSKKWKNFKRGRKGQGQKSKSPQFKM